MGRRLGGELMRLRTAAGLRQPHAAKALTASTTKIAKMEGGWVPMRDPDIRALCELYGADIETIGYLLELARLDRERRKARGWWVDFPLTGNMKEYIALEQAATTIRVWHPTFIPGLLQTPDYIRVLRRDAAVTPRADQDETFVAARLERQRRLHEPRPLRLEVVLHEAALRHTFSDASIMFDQLQHLLAVGKLPNVAVRLYPFNAGVTAGLETPFNIISFSDDGAMDVVYVEVPLTQLWIEGGEGAAKYRGLYEKIAQRALSETDSRSLIAKIAEELQ
ncbi:DNA-binding protein [Streptomyces sp. NRRL F-5755]|nr:DNA-binding protein [Streptomyces sp. NRRL F-5755]